MLRNIFQPHLKIPVIRPWHSHQNRRRFAVKVGADRIVMHSGSVSFFFSRLKFD